MTQNKPSKPRNMREFYDATDHIWTQTSSGRSLSLLAPERAQIDFVADIAPQLARQTRFNGAVVASPYSIAQHCVLGADALYQETRDPVIAAYFLLHDAHEAYTGDITSPVHQALSELGRAMGVGFQGNDIGHVIDALKAGIDKAILSAAGLAMPSQDIRSVIKVMDIRMLATERRDLLAPAPLPWGGQVERAEPIRGPRIKPWPWPKSVEQWLDRLARYCPTALNHTIRSAAP